MYIINDLFIIYFILSLILNHQNTTHLIKKYHFFTIRSLSKKLKQTFIDL